MEQMKNDLKDLAKKIRNGKSGRKPKNRNDFNKKDYDDLVWNRTKFRYIHIAYCLMRGRRLGEIEVPCNTNKPRIEQVRRYLKNYISHVTLTKDWVIEYEIEEAA